jgi:uncharacterized repeat protein (TIGR04138 family)
MEKDLLTVVKSTRYPLGAFLFVQRGLDFTVRRIHGDPPPGAPDAGETDAAGASGVESAKSRPVGSGGGGESRHVRGQQLCIGLRDYALQQYGLLARTVLRQWHITSSEDFGRIVFAMVEAGLMHKTAEDSLRDFSGALDFAEAFSPTLQLSENN